MRHKPLFRWMLSVIVGLVSAVAGIPTNTAAALRCGPYPEDIDKGLPEMSADDKQCLADAWAYYEDDTVERDRGIQKLEEFLDRVPDTPFRAEIYFRIGYLYGPGYRERFGEVYNAPKMCAYFKKSVEEYAGQYGGYLTTAWTSLMSSPHTSISERIEYYAWLLKMQESMTVDDFFPYREIGNYVRGYPIRFSQEQKEECVELVKEYHLPKDIYVAGRSIMQRSSPDELLELARAFPGTALAEKCLELRASYDKAVSRSLVDDLGGTGEKAIEPAPSPLVDPGDSAFSHETERASSLADRPDRPERNDSRMVAATILGVLLLVLLVTAGGLWRRFAHSQR